MKKDKKKPDDEMRPEYDFSKADRGKFYRPLDKGYKVHIHQDDGTVVVNHFTLAEGTVLLAPDVREYFSDSQSVNDALRSLIALMEKVPAKKYSAQSSSSHQVADKKE
jgi:hypothetical protein